MRLSDLRRSLLMGTAVAVSGIAGYGRAALADCAPTVSPNYLCSGVTTTSQSISVTGATVNTANGFSLVTSDSTGVSVEGEGDISFTDTYQSTISGNDSGVVAAGLGGGSTSVEVTGDVTGTDRYGIWATNRGTDLTVTTGADSSIYGGEVGIGAVNYGSGDLTITADGEVKGAQYNGVQATNYGVDMTVTTGAESSVYGGTRGMYVKNSGTGAFALTVNGDVTGAQYHGIYARNYGTDLTVTAGTGSNVTGGTEGLSARNIGTGALTVTADGSITGNDGYAIDARNEGTDLTISTGDGSQLYGYDGGVRAINLGSGALSITAGGDIATGRTFNHSGIFATNYGTDLTVTTEAGSSVLGDAYGILVANQGSGALSVTANGDVTGNTYSGIVARNVTGTDLTVSTGSGSYIWGSGSGIAAYNFGSGAVSITANGSVTALSTGIHAINDVSGTGVTVATGEGSTVEGGALGIQAYNFGTGALTVEANGEVTGDFSFGIAARNYGTDLTVTTGTGSDVYGGSTGLSALNRGSGALTMTVDGDVTGSGFAGIGASNFGTDVTVTTGEDTVVSGGWVGIGVYNGGTGELSITANGSVAGQLVKGIDGVNKAAATNMMISTGADSEIYGRRTGIEAKNYGSGVLSILADGVVTGSQYYGIAARNYGTNLTVTTGAGSEVYGGKSGIIADNFGSGSLSITADGSVTGKQTYGIFALNYGTDLTVTAGADSTVTGINSGIQADNRGTGELSVTANGSVSGQGAGVLAINRQSGTDLTVTTGPGSSAVGGSVGINAVNLGTGALTLTAGGEVNGLSGFGITTRNYGTDLTITLGAGSEVYGKIDGISTYNRGSGALTMSVDGDVVGGVLYGISALGYGTDLNVTVGGDADVSGASRGISVGNIGTGALSLTADGHVSGTGEGINAYNFGNATNMTIDAGAGSYIHGEGSGIRAQNNGSGALSITADGEVTGSQYYGILAGNHGTDLTVTTGEESSISGGKFGIALLNDGTGALALTVNGDVDGMTGMGASVENGERSTGGVTVATGVGSSIYGGANGLGAWNHGAGDVSVTVDGSVIVRGPSSGFGPGPALSAYNSAAGADVTVITGAESEIYSTHGGIVAINKGSGELAISANGDVAGGDFLGISAVTYGSGVTVTTGEGSSVSGSTGISAWNEGTGMLSVTANGDVTGTNGYGILAVSSGSNVTVTSGEGSNVSGGIIGIAAQNYGSGALTVTADGEVNGKAQYGIYARNYGTDLSVTVGGAGVASGGIAGIAARNNGTGSLVIMADGEVSGGAAGIRAGGSEGSTLIDVSGAVHNSSGAFGDQAIISASATTLMNDGVIVGRIGLSDSDDSVSNGGRWLTAGESDFGLGSDQMSNRGLILAGGTAGTADTTQFEGLERVVNRGTVSLVDEAAHGGSEVSDQLSLSGDYKGRDGTLALDVNLGAKTATADMLNVAGNTSGTTLIALNQTQKGLAGWDADGVALVTVAGASAASDFALQDGPIESGLYRYDIVYDDRGTDATFLLKGFTGLHSVELPAIVSGAQNIFFGTSESWVERQDQLRDGENRRNVVVAVADPPVAAQADENGLWLSLRGASTQRDGEAKADAPGKSYFYDTGYDQSTFSAMGGADFGTGLANGTLLFGVLGGYFTSASNLDASGTQIDYQGGSFGGYATYLQQGFFADVLGKADIFAMDYEAQGAGGSTSSSGASWGFRSDTGYRYEVGAAWLEPVASLAAVWTRIDDFGLYGASVQTGTNDAVQLGAGLRAGWRGNGLDASLTGRVWDGLGDGNTVGIDAPVRGVYDVTDASFTGVFGEVSGQLGYSLSERASLRLTGSYLFGADQTAISGAAGLDITW